MKYEKKIEAEAEMYFIQYCFCVSRELLLKNSRPLYDAFFTKYLQIYKEGKSQEQDLQTINKAFEKSF